MILCLFVSIIEIVLFASCIKADKVDSAVELWLRNNKVRGAAVAFYDGSDPKNVISLRRGYGKISAAENAKSVTTDTVFQLASVSKPFAASAVAKLVDLGMIPNIDQDICDVIPTKWSRSACRNPNYRTSNVTWRHLMTHRSSMVDDIPDVYLEKEDRWVSAQYGPANYWNEDAMSYGNPTCPLTDVQNFYHTIMTQDDDASTTIGGGSINWFKAIQSEYGGSWYKSIRPGSAYKYSNYAVGYLAALVEMAITKKTGNEQSFEQFCQQYIFQVLGMTNTSWFYENIPSTRRADGTLYQSKTKSFKDVGYNCYIDYTSGQLYSSVNDMSKYLQSMLSFGVPKLWSKNVGSQLLSCLSGTRVCKQRNNMNQVGFGWFIMTNSMKRTMFPNSRVMDVYNWTNGGYHDGVVYGISTVMIVFPSSNMYVVVLANTDSVDVDDLATTVIKAARK